MTFSRRDSLANLAQFQRFKAAINYGRMHLTAETWGLKCR